ncbi:glycosyl transferase family 2 [Isosphaera pallida ATCC 43644]|uniref:Glycosyl transferase family 2 n=1 Tax=Isosphaera pallida (strain ATCC 43644 / DSM 9630 / IS1B) TaxID=575540 RepID=E8R3S0_ISOPI|nr:glycosyltransferase family 2 protein [Isosphaera pallida]ADV62655.1 glycosyl transferase family 2 [Isosphaera pallida ATCC 43644]
MTTTMSLTQTIILGGLGAIVSWWAARHLGLTILSRRLDQLDERAEGFKSDRPQQDWPLVTAIIPAKDEESTLADCLNSVLAQDYPRLEVIVVDDRSRDRTRAIAENIAARDPRVRVLPIDHLPEGWTGKTHALHVASQHAKGDWLWFLDADTRHIPRCLSIVLAHAIRHDAALASVLPTLRGETFWENLIQPLAGVVLMRAFPLVLVNSRHSRRAFANGQFILVRRDAYHAVGGHEVVRHRFVEDIYLARRVKEAGFAIRVSVAPRLSSTRMYTSLGQIVRGWSRILYDARGRDPWPLAWLMIEPLIFTKTGQLALPASLFLLSTATTVNQTQFAQALLALALAHAVLSVSLLHRLYRYSTRHPQFSLGYALAGLIMDVVLFRSLWMCWTGKVTWRGTTYAASTREPRRLSLIPMKAEPLRPPASVSRCDLGPFAASLELNDTSSS